MKQVHHLAIIGQPAFEAGKNVNCPHCNQQALVREDGSAYCLESNRSFAPEPSDAELFAMRQTFDRRHGIELHHRHQMVPSLLAASGYDAADPNRPFHPELTGVLERVASGAMLPGINRVFA